MKAVILAAGEGIRMRPLTETTPKPLLPLLGRPLLYHLVQSFPENIRELIIVIGYLGEQIVEYCGDNFLGRAVRYIWQKKKEGTYPALKLCKPLLMGEDSFFVAYADDLIDKKAVAACIAKTPAVIVKETDRPERFGVVLLNADGSVRSIIEKPERPESNLVITSGVSLTPNIFKYPPEPHPVRRERFLSTAIGEMAQHEKVWPIKTDFWFPIGTPEDLEKAEKMLQARK